VLGTAIPEQGAFVYRDAGKAGVWVVAGIRVSVSVSVSVAIAIAVAIAVSVAIAVTEAGVSVAGRAPATGAVGAAARRSKTSGNQK
jgi:hypothetical protein